MYRFVHQFMGSIFSDMYSGVELVDFDKKYYQIGESLGYATGINLSILYSTPPVHPNSSKEEDIILPILVYEEYLEDSISNIEFRIRQK
jgi:hypothetical protein